MKSVENFKVVELKRLNAGQFIIHLVSSKKLQPIHAGNFAEMRIPGNNEVFLRRPFSIYDFDPEERRISFYIKVLGKGSRQLMSSRIGDEIDIVYPLGNSFSIPSDAGKVLIVAGGTGIAPFVLLCRRLREIQTSITVLLGGKTAGDIPLINEFRPFGEVLLTTEDGTGGIRGLVTDHPVLSGPRPVFNRIYSCGPEPMMQAVARIARRHEIPCEVSLENTMACGFGACLCCVTATTTGNRCVCTDGPVFNTLDLLWQT